MRSFASVFSPKPRLVLARHEQNAAISRRAEMIAVITVCSAYLLEFSLMQAENRLAADQTGREARSLIF
jgi:hypothetical protein